MDGGSPNLPLRTLESLKTSNNSQPDTSQLYGLKAPDATFFNEYKDALPTLVMEVAYSQPEAELKKLAQQYIIGSKHNIRCVIGINLPYPRRNSKMTAEAQGAQSQETATVSIWRPYETRRSDGQKFKSFTCDLEAVPFCSISEDALELRLSDFLPKPASNIFSPNDTVVKIPLSKLREALDKAESTPDPSASPALLASSGTTT